MGTPSVASPKVPEQICGAESRHPQANLERGVSMATPPREPGLAESQLQLLRGEVVGGRGIAQRWGRGSPLIPPSQTLIRLQMADGPPPLLHFHDKGKGTARQTLVTLLLPMGWLLP